ncbi:epsE [Symbiodinium sp. CCMP2456]|nr:epsE [Symbiodinium sp. CCMP2456]
MNVGVARDCNLCGTALDVQASFSKLARQLSRALSSTNDREGDVSATTEAEHETPCMSLIDTMMQSAFVRSKAQACQRVAYVSGWSEAEVANYFQSVDEGCVFISAAVFCVGEVEQTAGAPLSILDGLLQPERHHRSHTRAALPLPDLRRYREHYFDSDASEDGTSAILQHYADTRPNVRIVDSNGVQQGVAGCLREGWEHCRGRFVARLDADDEADLQRLSKQLRYMEQHPSVSVLGGRHRSFFTEHRKFTVERISKKEDGRVVAAVWREFHGQQTSRAREQICLAERGEQVLVVEGPAEYLNCRLLRVGEESMVLHPERWQEALSAAQGGRGEVLLLRRDPLEPAQGGRWMHPCLVRAASLFEECVLGTTCLFRKSHFGEDCPFKREEAENHWLWLGLESCPRAR